MAQYEHQKWEYKFLDTKTGLFSNSKIKTELDLLGKEGWEAIGMAALDSGRVEILFKRKRV